MSSTSLNVALVKKGSQPNTTLQWLLILPAMLFLAILLIAAVMVLRISLGTQGAEWSTWSIGAYSTLMQNVYFRSVLLTFKLAFLSTAIVIVLSFPIAVSLARTTSASFRRVILFVLLLPLLINLLIQSYGWLVVLAPNGVLNRFLISIGIIHHPILFLFNQSGVLAGLVQTTFPLAALPMAGTIRHIPRSLEEAGSVLGATRTRVILEILIPLATPGILAASILVFAFNASAFVIPLLIGGGRVPMMALLIRDQMGPLLNWPLGGATATVLITLTLIAVLSYQLIVTRRIGGRSSL